MRINQDKSEEPIVSYTNEELVSLAKIYYPGPKGISFYDSVVAIMEDHAAKKKAAEKIRIQYTDDYFGRAAKLLGLPRYTYFGEDAGFDLPVVLPEEDKEHGLTIFPHERIMLRTGMILEFPKECWGRIIHRSSSERRFRLRVIEGVIDAYRNELIAQVHNMNSFPIVIRHGQKIVQLILSKVVCYEIEEATTPLRPSMRGMKGFGSSGT